MVETAGEAVATYLSPMTVPPMDVADTVTYLWDNATADDNSTTNATDPENEGIHRSVPEVVSLAILLGLVIITTIAGNLLVCVTIATNKKLQNCTNYFVVSLATTDLMLGCFVLPFSAVNTLSPSWPLGYIFCNIYTSSDVMLCTVSILTLFAISLDRYFAITTPLRYQQKMNSRVAWRINGAIWVASLILAFLPIHLGLNSPNVLEVMNKDNPSVCGFALNKPYVLVVSLGTYFAPLVVMCGVYLKVLQITRRQVKEINRLTKPGSAAMATAAMLEENGDGPNRHHHHNRHKESKVVSDTKATVTLASVVLAFAICWIPYFVLFTAKPFLRGSVNIHLDLFALWLGYVNSAVNPFLYAFYNSSFREGFKQVLQCHRFPYRRAMSPSFSSEVNNFKQQRLNSASETSELSALKQHV